MFKEFPIQSEVNTVVTVIFSLASNKINQMKINILKCRTLGTTHDTQAYAL